MTAVEKDCIKAGERRELKSLVRMRVKVLRAEMEQRHMTMLAEIEGRVAKKFKDERDRVEELQKKLDQVVAEANRKFGQLFSGYIDIVEPRKEFIGRPWFTQRDTGKDALRRALIAAVDAETNTARHRVIKLEAELLSTLSLDALHSDAAKEFVRSIPTVEAIMSSQVMAEVEAGFKHDH